MAVTFRSLRSWAARKKRRSDRGFSPTFLNPRPAPTPLYRPRLAISWSQNCILRRNYYKHRFPRAVGWDDNWPYWRAMNYPETVRWKRMKREAMELSKEFEWSA